MGKATKDQEQTLADAWKKAVAAQWRSSELARQPNSTPEEVVEAAAAAVRGWHDVREALAAKGFPPGEDMNELIAIAYEKAEMDFEVVGHG